MPHSAWLLPSHPSFPIEFHLSLFRRHRASPRTVTPFSHLLDSIRPIWSLFFPFEFGSKNQECIAYDPIILLIIFPFTLIGV